LQAVPTDHFTFDAVGAASLLNLMSSSVRIEVLRRVIDREWDVGTLSTDLNLSQSALSQHLAKLRAAKLVKTRRAAQRIFYSSNSAAVATILTVLESLGSLPVSSTIAQTQERSRYESARKRKRPS